uniref:Uncharacterized protein n=1 Tax=Molossus molossus TaxID=27622 RepID=A0A7J8BKL9_MOLMO|nr:hypothetical protein HJG59_010160 [Molossus molossus]
MRPVTASTQHRDQDTWVTQRWRAENPEPPRSTSPLALPHLLKQPSTGSSAGAKSLSWGVFGRHPEADTSPSRQQRWGGPGLRVPDTAPRWPASSRPEAGRFTVPFTDPGTGSSVKSHSCLRSQRYSVTRTSNDGAQRSV